MSLVNGNECSYVRLTLKPTAVPRNTGSKIEAAGWAKIWPGMVNEGMYVVILRWYGLAFCKLLGLSASTLLWHTMLCLVPNTVGTFKESLVSTEILHYRPAIFFNNRLRKKGR